MSLDGKLIDNLSGCFCTKMEEHVGYCVNVEKHVKDLVDAKERLAAKSKDVEYSISQGAGRGEVSTNDAQTWLGQVKEKEKEAARIEEEYKKMYTCLGCFAPNIWSRYRIGVKASVTLHNLNNSIEKPPVEVTTMGPPVAVQEKALASEPIGMDPYFNKAIEYLLDDREGIIGILGTPGVGKTTLLRRINNDFHPEHGKRKDFDYVIFILVSDDSKPESLQDHIAKRLGLSWQEKATVDSYAEDLRRFLKNKSFLLLLDDLRAAINLCDIGIPHASRSSASGDQFKHYVVFTTRSSRVYSKMVADKAIEMKGLDPQSALLLLRQRVGEYIINSDPQFQSLAEEIVEECDGLPSDLIDIGENLSSKTSFEACRYVVNAWKNPSHRGSDRPVFPSLKDIYDGLEVDVARACFLSCVFWPKNLSIQRGELIEYWIGLGYIDEGAFPKIHLAYDRGHFLIDSLNEACLLEPVCSSGSQVRLPKRSRRLALQVAFEYGNKLSKWIVRAGDKLTEAPHEAEEWKLAEHISLMHNEISALPSQTLSCPNLQTLVLKGNPPLKVIPPCFFQGMPALTFLDLSHTGIEELPEEIGSLVELRYLNLSWTMITSLPKKLEELVKLKHLLLYQTSQLKAIPCELLSKLNELCVLDLTGSGYAYYGKDDAPKEKQRSGRPSIDELIQQIRLRRRGFRSLGITIVSPGALRCLSDLSSLPISRLWIIKLEGLYGPLKLLDFLGSSNMRDSMKELTLMRSASLEEMEMVASGDTTISKLEILRLMYLDKLNKISWNRFSPCSSLTGFRELTIYRCGMLKQVIHLVENSTGAEMDSRERPIPAFPSLRSLILIELPMLENICDSACDFPCLESIKVSGCPKLKKLPFKPNGKLRVIKCEMGWWEELDWEDKNIKSSLDSLVIKIPSIPVYKPPVSTVADTFTPRQPPGSLVVDPSRWAALLYASFPLLFFFFIFCRVFPLPIALCCILVLSIVVFEWMAAVEDEWNPKAMAHDILEYLQDWPQWKAVEEEEKYDDALEWQEDLTRWQLMQEHEN